MIRYIQILNFLSYLVDFLKAFELSVALISFFFLLHFFSPFDDVVSFNSFPACSSPKWRILQTNRCKDFMFFIISPLFPFKKNLWSLIMISKLSRCFF
ncbi:hypothetical protein CW304_05970 [Bacillus sp. UFRGS-B20]|nr:hypothetical protein CW304_05970 [Bacillus sp. UFRGS-B20]